MKTRRPRTVRQIEAEIQTRRRRLTGFRRDLEEKRQQSNAVTKRRATLLPEATADDSEVRGQVATLADEQVRLKLEVEDLDSVVGQIEGTLTDLTKELRRTNRADADTQLRKMLEHRQQLNRQIERSADQLVALIRQHSSLRQRMYQTAEILGCGSQATLVEPRCIGEYLRWRLAEHGLGIEPAHHAFRGPLSRLEARLEGCWFREENLND